MPPQQAHQTLIQNFGFPIMKAHTRTQHRTAGGRARRRQATDQFERVEARSSSRTLSRSPLGGTGAAAGGTVDARVNRGAA